MILEFSSMVISDLSVRGHSFSIWSVIIYRFLVSLIANYRGDLKTWSKVIGIMLRFHVKSLIGQMNSENLLPCLQGWGYMCNAFVRLRILLSFETTLKMLMTLKTPCSHLYYLFAPLLMVHIRILDVSMDSNTRDPSNTRWHLIQGFQ